MASPEHTKHAAAHDGAIETPARAAALPEAKTLAQAIVAAQLHAQAVAKDATNAYHGYRYASAEAVIAEARRALGVAGLALVRTAWRIAPGVRAQIVDKDGVVTETGWTSDVHVTYRLLHGASGELMDFPEQATPVLPEKGRPEDKALAAALTFNLSYFLVGLLLLPREEGDAAVDQRDDRDREPRATVAPSAAPAAPMARTPRRMESRFPGECACGARVIKGTMIDYADRRVVGCVACAFSGRAVQAAALATDAIVSAAQAAEARASSLRALLARAGGDEKSAVAQALCLAPDEGCLFVHLTAKQASAVEEFLKDAIVAQATDA